MRQKLGQYIAIIQSDPAVDVVTGNIGARSNQAAFNVTLKPLEERKVSADQVINRLRPRLARVPGSHAVPAGGAGCADRRPRWAMRNSSTPCRETTLRSCSIGRREFWRA